MKVEEGLEKEKVVGRGREGIELSERERERSKCVM